MSELAAGCTLQDGKYTIVRTLGQGGFGITYLAEHNLLGKKVAIKEFFYKNYCERDEATNTITLGTQSSAEQVERFRNKFMLEARHISKFRHPNIIAIHDIFTENNTAYYVMEYIEGPSLNDVVKESNGLDEETALLYFRKMADALKCIHSAHVNHLDVKPANIMLRESDGEVILIDFGTSKQYDADTDLAPTTTTPVGVSAGYAPIEQYSRGGVAAFTPESDIYALGATLYKLLTGETPTESIDLEETGLPLLHTLSPRSQHIISSCMQVIKVNRPHSIAEVESLLTDKLDDEDTKLINIGTENADGDEEQPSDDAVDGDEEEQPDNSGDEQPDDNDDAVDGGEYYEEEPSFLARHGKSLLFALLFIIGIAAGALVYKSCNQEPTTNGGAQITELEEESDFDGDEKATDAPKAEAPEAETTEEAPAAEPKPEAAKPAKAEEPKAPRLKTQDELQEAKPQTNDNAATLRRALANGDYSTVQRLANSGYAPSYVPLAMYYLDHREYDSANTYAQKAKRAGQSGAQTIITTLDNLGYYD